MSTILTTAEEYDDPVKYKLSLFKPDESEEVFTYNSFNLSNPPFALTDIGVELAVGTTGSFSFKIDDSKDKVINDTNLDCGYVALIQGAKKESDLQNLAFGIIDDITEDYPAGNLRKFTFSGLGFYTIFNYTILNFIKSANKEDLTGTEQVFNNPDFRIDNLALNLFESTDVLPVRNSKTLKQRGNFNTDQIANSVKELLPSANFQYSTAANILEHFAASSGTVLWVGPDREVIFRQPQKKHSGITIRPWDSSRINDNANVTSYYYGGWNAKKMMKVDQGFFNRIFLTINTDSILSTSPGETTTNYASLANKDIAQQFIPGTTRLTNVALMLSKTGTGRSTVDDAYNLTGVQGVIVKDDGNNKPSNKVIARFIIPYADIGETPTVIYKIDLQYNVSSIDTSFKHWIILFKRGESEESTIRWYHDSDVVTPSTSDVPRYSGTKTPFTDQPQPSLEPDFNLGFNSSSTGPVYRFSFFSTKNTTIEVSDPFSIKKYTPGRPVEIRVNAPWITDLKTGIKYANSLLQYGAKLKKIYEKKTVSIPTKMFFPLQLVSIIYPLAGLDTNTHTTAEINSVRYQASAGSADSPFGSYTVELTATGYVNHFQGRVTDSLIC